MKDKPFSEIHEDEKIKEKVEEIAEDKLDAVLKRKSDYYGPKDILPTSEYAQIEKALKDSEMSLDLSYEERVKEHLRDLLSFRELMVRELMGKGKVELEDLDEAGLEYMYKGPRLFMENLKTSLADTVEKETAKGKYPYLIEEGSDAQLFMGVDLIDKLGDFETEMFSSLMEYLGSGNREQLREANDKIFERSSEVAKEIRKSVEGLSDIVNSPSDQLRFLVI